MSATKSPPADWTIEPHGDAHALYSGRDDNHHGLRLLNLSDGDEHFAAVCALIRAAPDLLAACAALLEFWDHGTPVHPGAEVVADVRAAIAKTKGLSS